MKIKTTDVKLLQEACISLAFQLASCKNKHNYAISDGTLMDILSNENLMVTYEEI